MSEDCIAATYNRVLSLQHYKISWIRLVYPDQVLPKADGSMTSDQVLHFFSVNIHIKLADTENESVPARAVAHEENVQLKTNL